MTQACAGGSSSVIPVALKNKCCLSVHGGGGGGGGVGAVPSRIRRKSPFRAVQTDSPFMRPHATLNCFFLAALYFHSPPPAPPFLRSLAPTKSATKGYDKTLVGESGLFPPLPFPSPSPSLTMVHTRTRARVCARSRN